MKRTLLLLLFYKKANCVSMMDNHSLKYLQIFYVRIEPGNGKGSKAFQRSKMNFFLHMLLSFPSSIRSETELSVMTYIIQKFFLWKGQGFSFPPSGAGQGSYFRPSGSMRSHWGSALVMLPEESKWHLMCTSKGLGKNKFGIKCLFIFK